MRGWEEREHKKVEETSRECEGVTNPKRDAGKKQREWGGKGKREMKKEKVIEIKVWRAHDR